MTTEVAKKPSNGELMKAAGNQNLPAAQRVNSLRDLLSSPAVFDQVFGALPGNVDPERFKRVLITTIRNNPALLDCDLPGLLTEVSQASSLGLEIDGVLGHAYLVPYKRKATLIPGFKGLLSLVRKSGEVLEVRTRCVYEGDDFDFSEGDEPFIRHKPRGSHDDASEITHVYLVAKFRNGGTLRSVWTREMIDTHRDRYCQTRRSDSPWRSNWPEMARKTLIRDAVARGELPVSAEVQRFASAEEIIEADFSRRTAASPRSVAAITAQLDGDVIDANEPVPDELLPDSGETLLQLMDALAECSTLDELEAVGTDERRSRLSPEDDAAFAGNLSNALAVMSETETAE